jgi:hypothetical protein
MRNILLSILFAFIYFGSAQAQPAPPGSPPPPGPPPPEVLATVPDLTPAQQTEVRKILVERRDAQEAAQAKARVEFDALRVKERGERERIDEQSADRLRKLLGDDGYRKFAEWELSHRGPQGPGAGPGGGPHPPMRGDHPGKGDAPPPAPGGGPGRGAPGSGNDE